MNVIKFQELNRSEQLELYDLLVASLGGVWYALSLFMPRPPTQETRAAR